MEPNGTVYDNWRYFSVNERRETDTPFSAIETNKQIEADAFCQVPKDFPGRQRPVRRFPNLNNERKLGNEHRLDPEWMYRPKPVPT
jgi:hypothetical protein